MTILKRMLQHSPLDRVFSALADPSRRHMIEKLARGPASVTALGEKLPITLAAVVQHVQVLEESGLVRTEKKGRVRMCRLEPKGLSTAERWFHDRRAFWEQSLDALEQLLAGAIERKRQP